MQIQIQIQIQTHVQNQMKIWIQMPTWGIRHHEAYLDDNRKGHGWQMKSYQHYIEIMNRAMIEENLLMQAFAPMQWTQWRSVGPQLTRKGVTRIWTWKTFTLRWFHMYGRNNDTNGDYDEKDNDNNDNDLFVCQGLADGEPEMDFSGFSFHPFSWIGHQSNLVQHTFFFS